MLFCYLSFVGCLFPRGSRFGGSTFLLLYHRHKSNKAHQSVCGFQISHSFFSAFNRRLLWCRSSNHLPTTHLPQTSSLFSSSSTSTLFILIIILGPCTHFCHHHPCYCHYHYHPYPHHNPQALSLSLLIVFLFFIFAIIMIILKPHLCRLC